MRQATQIAVSRAGGGGTPPRALMALAAGVAVAGLVFALATGKRGGGGEDWTVMALIAATALVLGVVVALKRR